MGSTAQQQQGVNPNADEFKRVGGNKVHVNKVLHLCKKPATCLFDFSVVQRLFDFRWSSAGPPKN
eukprot:SAG31_NODE_87_length_26728_cov_40.161591_10_plen_65_part_00